MTTVSRIALAALILMTGCSASGGSPATTAARPTVPTPIVTTTTPTQDLAVQGCDSPPITFSSLCEVFGHIEDWYVDAPVDPETLAGLALRGLSGFVTTDTESRPRTLFCAIPDEAFEPVCHTLADRVLEEQLPVGPAMEAAVYHMVNGGLDPFTYYLPPDQVGAIRANGIVGGVGLILDARDAAGSKCSQITDPCRLEVVVVLEDNPGFDAGLEPGDVITAVDGETVDGQGFTSVVAEIAGDETGIVAITVERGSATLEFDIDRAQLMFPTVQYQLLPSSVGYIRIPDFEADIPGLVQDALSDLLTSDPGTLVVDLRDNPGGYVDAVIDVADQFVDGGVLMSTSSSSGVFDYEASPGGLATSQRLVVLVNQGTASAAEILTGALRDRRGASVVGENTFGKNAVQIPFTLRNGGELYVVVEHWSTPNGESAVNGGLVPDNLVSWPVGASIEQIVAVALEAVT